MKILITAPPGIGKSTAIDKVVQNFDGNKRGIVAREILDGEGKRIGFTSINILSQSKQFMFLAEAPGTGSIGGEFNVDIDAIDSFVVPELEEGLKDSKSLLYVDEIGRAQAKSKTFLSALRGVFKSKNPLLATIVYENEPWSLEFKQNDEVCLIELTKENRDLLPNILLSAFNNTESFYSLSTPARRTISHLLQELLKSGYFISAQKLFDNAIFYVLENRVHLKTRAFLQDEYLIEGKTNAHKLVHDIKENKFICDCHLANGTGIYFGQSQPCSHQLSVRLTGAFNDSSH